MIRILYFTDPHARGTNPRARIDSYPDAIKAKLRECWSLADTYSCDAVVCGGDLFDRPDPEYIVTGGIATVLCECPVPLYTVSGNHEIYGYNLDTVPRTALGLLVQLGLVKLLSRKPVFIEDKKGERAVCLTGQGYYGDIDRGPGAYQCGLSNDPNCFKAHVVHGMLLEKPLPYDAPCTLIKDIQTDADAVLSGHDHKGFGFIKRLDGKWFINPGSLGRVDASVDELYRQVRVALLTFDEECGLEVELLPVKSARPGTEVLSRDALIREAERENRVSRFLELLKSGDERKYLKIEEIVTDIAGRDQLPDAVRVDALQRIGDAREALGARG